MSGQLEITSADDGAVFPVLAAPRASKSAVVGVHGGALKVRLAAPPVDGAANDELVATLAKYFRVAKSAVVILGGAASKRKRVKIKGLGPEEISGKISG